MAKLEPQRSIPMTPRVKKILAIASKQARTAGHDYVGIEHLLIGIYDELEDVGFHSALSRLPESHLQYLNQKIENTLSIK